MRKPALSISILLAAASLTLGACGGVDKNAYVTSVTKVQQTTQKDASDLSTQMAKAKTPAEVAASLRKLGANVIENSNRLKAIEPPKEVKAEHTKYVNLMKNFGTSLEALSTRVASATSKNVGDVLTDASTLTTKLSTDESQIVNDINTKLQS